MKKHITTLACHPCTLLILYCFFFAKCSKDALGIQPGDTSLPMPATRAHYSNSAAAHASSCAGKTHQGHNQGTPCRPRLPPVHTTHTVLLLHNGVQERRNKDTMERHFTAFACRLCSLIMPQWIARKMHQEDIRDTEHRVAARIKHTSSLLSSARRRHRDRMSPTAGPPRTRTISAVLPPSSLTGSTCATRVVSSRMCSEATAPVTKSKHCPGATAAVTLIQPLH